MGPFSEVYQKFSQTIGVIALSQHVPGLDYDDVVSEMKACLWVAWKQYQAHLGRFESYWWSLWLNRRSDLTRMALRVKRPRTVSAGDCLPDEPYLMALFPQPPEKTTEQGREVWCLLAGGARPHEVRQQTGLSRRGYYDLISRWRTPEVRDMLSSM